MKTHYIDEHDRVNITVDGVSYELPASDWVLALLASVDLQAAVQDAAARSRALTMQHPTSFYRLELESRPPKGVVTREG